MSRRRRHRDHERDLVTERHPVHAVMDRSKLARLSLKVKSATPAVRKRIDRLNKLVRRVARPPVRSSLRTVKLTISPQFALKHGTVRATRTCVQEKLSGFSNRSGSGASKKKSRSTSRRELFQAARRSC